MIRKDCSLKESPLDWTPIVTCPGKRRSKVANELVDTIYYTTKNMWYYGLKLHFLLDVGHTGFEPVTSTLSR
jgi:hypothetical protein